MSNRQNKILNWVKFILFIVAAGILFGVEAALDIVKTYGELFVAVVISMGLLFSTHLVFEHFERKFGEKVAVLIMFTYVIVGLPFVMFLLSLILKPISSILD